MGVGTTSGIIDEPVAKRVAIFHGRDRDGGSAFSVSIELDDGTRFEFAINSSEVLAYAAHEFSSAVAWDAQVKSVLTRDLLNATNQDIDIEEAGDDELIGYVTDVKAAAERFS